MSISFCAMIPIVLGLFVTVPMLVILFRNMQADYRERLPRRRVYLDEDSEPKHKVNLFRPSPKVVGYSTLVTAASILIVLSFNGTIRFVSCGEEDLAVTRAMAAPVQKICNCGCSQHRMLAAHE